MRCQTNPKCHRTNYLCNKCGGCEYHDDCLVESRPFWNASQLHLPYPLNHPIRVLRGTAPEHLEWTLKQSLKGRV